MWCFVCCAAYGVISLCCTVSLGSFFGHLVCILLRLGKGVEVNALGLGSDVMACSVVAVLGLVYCVPEVWMSLDGLM